MLTSLMSEESTTSRYWNCNAICALATTLTAMEKAKRELEAADNLALAIVSSGIMGYLSL